MTNGHFIKKCRVCLKTLAQCRCMDPNKSIEWGQCDECSERKRMKKVYLGDSVYVDYERGQIVLTTENGMPDDPSHELNEIFLEDNVFEALLNYVEALKKNEEQIRPSAEKNDNDKNS